MLYINNSIDCRKSSGNVSVSTARAFAFTMLDALFGDLSLSEAQVGAFDSTYILNGSKANITISNPISINSLDFHFYSTGGNMLSKMGAGALGSGFSQLGNLKGNVLGGTVDQTFKIVEPNPCGTF